jgi:hypothetical protein
LRGDWFERNHDEWTTNASVDAHECDEWRERAR